MLWQNKQKTLEVTLPKDQWFIIWRLLAELVVPAEGFQLLSWDGANETCPFSSPTWSVFTSWPVSSPILSFLLCDLSFLWLWASLFLVIWFLSPHLCLVLIPFSTAFKGRGVLRVRKFLLRALRLHLCAAKKYPGHSRGQISHFHTRSVLL